MTQDNLCPFPTYYFLAKLFIFPIRSYFPKYSYSNLLYKWIMVLDGLTPSFSNTLTLIVDTGDITDRDYCAGLPLDVSKLSSQEFIRNKIIL